MSASPVIQTLAELVRINSINPAFPGGTPEAGVVAFCRAFFTAAGIETREQEVLPGRSNLVAVLPGRQPGRRLVLEAHMDTVGVSGMTIPPFQPELSGGRLFGRGACDTKGGLAAMMHALASLERAGITPPCEVWVAAAVDEEFSYRGVLKLCEGLEAAAAVVAEPTLMRLVTASKGCLRWRIVCRGVAAHSSKPETGVNAICNMARVILTLQDDIQRMAGRSHPLVGRPTLSPGTITGGTQVNIVPDYCCVELDRRLIPGEEVDDVMAHYAAVIGTMDVTARMEPPMLTDVPLETPAHSPIARTASEVLEEMGLDGSACGVPFGSDASKLSRAGVPSVVVGPGSIDRAHGDTEYVECEQVEQALEFYRSLMLRFE
jgi:acetylornithine deacetylase